MLRTYVQWTLGTVHTRVINQYEYDAVRDKNINIKTVTILLAVMFSVAKKIPVLDE